MVDLNIPEQNIEIKSINSKNYIFDLIRKKTSCINSWGMGKTKFG